MAALNFPTLPTLNQQYPTPAIPGVPVYTWDGEKWTTYGASITNAFPATALPLMDATPAVVGITSKYAREDHVHPTDTTRADATTVLVKSPQGLTPTEQTDVRKNVYAAPFDAMAYNGMQINGNFEVSQEFGSAPRTGTGYFCDGWLSAYYGTMVLQSGTALGTSNLKLAYIAANTAQTSLATDHYAALAQVIEGYRIYKLGWGAAGAQPITIAFWSYHSRPGLYCVGVRNGDATRSYVATYNHATTNVMQWNTITIPGCVDGTWNATNGGGISLYFMAAAGTAYNAPAANVWNTGGYISVAGQVNAVQAVNDSCRFLGVVVLPGIEAPSAARSPLIMRPYDQELLVCKRYYERAYEPGVANGALICGNGNQISYPGSHRALKHLAVGTANRGYSYQPFTVQMRAAPAMAYWCYGGVASAFTTFDINGAGSVNGYTGDSFRGVYGSTHGTVASNGAGNYYSACMWVADARL